MLKKLQGYAYKGINTSELVDSKGNPRFVEGDGVPLEQEGFTSAYCKWSLSGSHLMCVLAGTIENTTVITAGTVLASFELPDYIKDKIVAVWQTYLAYVSQSSYASDGTSQNITVFIEKTSSGLRLLKSGTLTLSANRSFRIQVDLLIDSE